MSLTAATLARQETAAECASATATNVLVAPDILGCRCSTPGSTMVEVSNGGDTFQCVSECAATKFLCRGFGPASGILFCSATQFLDITIAPALMDCTAQADNTSALQAAVQALQFRQTGLLSSQTVPAATNAILATSAE